MVSQNNHRVKQQRLLATNQVFSLRKLSIGFVSVVLGLFFACGTDVVGHAATTQPASSNTAAQISTPTKNSPVTPVNGQSRADQSLTEAKSNGQPVAQAAVADQETAEGGKLVKRRLFKTFKFKWQPRIKRIHTNYNTANCMVMSH